MSTKIFNADQSDVTVWSAQDCSMYWYTSDPGSNPSGGNQIPILVEAVASNFARGLRKIRPLNNKKRSVWLAGDPTGQLQLTGMYDPTGASIRAFLETANNTCPGGGIWITIHPSGSIKCQSNVKYEGTIECFKYGGCSIQGLGLNIQAAQDLTVVNIPITLQFTSLEIV